MPEGGPVPPGPGSGPGGPGPLLSGAPHACSAVSLLRSGWPGTQPCSRAVPSGPRTVTQILVCGLRQAAASRSRAASGSASPNPGMSAGPDGPPPSASHGITITGCAARLVPPPRLSPPRPPLPPWPPGRPRPVPFLGAGPPGGSSGPRPPGPPPPGSAPPSSGQSSSAWSLSGRSFRSRPSLGGSFSGRPSSAPLSSRGSSAPGPASSGPLPGSLSPVACGVGRLSRVSRSCRQVHHGEYAQLAQAARDPGSAQVQCALLDVLPGGERVGGGQFPG